MLTTTSLLFTGCYYFGEMPNKYPAFTASPGMPVNITLAENRFNKNGQMFNLNK